MIEKLLCVDDDKITLMIIKKMVEKTGFANEIITATNGREALDYYIALMNNTTEKDNYPRLIFLDLNMPVMGGWDFLDEFVNKIYPEFQETKVIILSSSSDAEDINKSKQYPIVVDYICKPISVSSLKNINI